MDLRADLGWQAIVVLVFLVATLPWLGGTPSDLMVWAFAVAPPVVLLGLLGARETQIEARRS